MFCPKCGKQASGKGRFCNKCGRPLPVGDTEHRESQYPPHSQSIEPIGKNLEGEYRIEEKIGCGSKSDVYRATRLSLGESVAIKLLHSHLVHVPEAKELFIRNAVSSLRLRHRNAAAVYEVGTSRKGDVHFISMELIKGTPLNLLLKENKPFDTDFIITIIAQVCSALDAAHRISLFHGGVTPEKIFIDQNDSRWQVKITGFGLPLTPTQNIDDPNPTSMKVRSVHYLSPEERRSGSVDARSNIYNVGVLLYELMCSSVGLTIRSEHAIPVTSFTTTLTPPGVLLPQLDPRICSIIDRAIHIEPESRFQSAKELSNELLAVASEIARRNESVFLSSLEECPVSDTEMPKPEERRISIQSVEVAETSREIETASPTFVSDAISSEIEEQEPDKGPRHNESHRVSTSDIVTLVDALDFNPANNDSIDYREAIEDVELFEDISNAADALVDNIVETSNPTETDGRTTTPQPDSDRPGDHVERPDSVGSSDDNAIPIPEVPLESFSESDVSISASDDNEPAVNGIVEVEDTSYDVADSLTSTWPHDRPRNSRIFVVLFGLTIVVSSGLLGVYLWSSNGQISEVVTTTNNSISDPAPSSIPSRMVLVKGGDFTMGHKRGGPYSVPPFKTTVDSFYMDIYETTNAEYKQFVNETGIQAPQGWVNETFPIGQENHPVTGVRWDDANAYAKWAGKRLPTETEWEYAARGQTDFIFPWGNEWRADCANADSKHNGTVVVGTYICDSPFGIKDMIGNAWEWTASDAIPYKGGPKISTYSGETLKVIRGGNWLSSPIDASAVNRGFYRGNNEDGYTGTSFRCVKDL